MSTDTFEDELRSLLRDSADAEGPAYVDIDPYAVVTSGLRVVRRRRLAAGAGIAAAVLAIAAAGAVVGGVGQNRASSVPATQHDTGVVAVDLEVAATIDGSPAAPGSVPRRVKFEVNESTHQWRAAIVDADAHVRMGDAHTLPNNSRVARYAEVGGDGTGLVVGLMPAAATDIVAVWRTDSIESSFSSAPVPGTDRQVFAVQYSYTPDPNIPGSTMFAGFDWTDGQTVSTSAGTGVPSARLGDAVVFVDETQNVFGIFGPDTTASKRLSDTPEGKLPAMMTGKVPDGSDTMDSTVLVLLPAGAQGVTVSAAPGATVRSVDTVPGGSTGQTMVLVRLAEPKASSGTGIEQVRWTGSDGRAASGTLG